MGNSNEKGGTTGGNVNEEVRSKDTRHNRKKDESGFAEKGGVGLDDFSLLKTVGKGSFAKVIQVRKNDSGKVYAMKVLKKETIVRRRQVAHTMAERSILEDIDHPFIVSLRYAFQSQTKLYMVFDYFNGGELFNYLSKGRFSLERSRLYAAEICLALEHLHNLNIVYRDLKPENLLLDADGHIRLTDFGLSKENVKGNSASSFVGTPEYLAPEMIRKQRYGKAVDWWCLGTLLYEMLGGLPPFYDTNVKKMYKKVLENPLVFPSHFTPEACDLISRMLEKNPERRILRKQIKEHPFFAPLRWDLVMQKKISPPFQPRVRGDSDTDNIASNFLKIPAALSPTPQDHPLQLEGEEGADLFPNFSFVHSSLMANEENIYSVSVCEEDYPPPTRSAEMDELEHTDAMIMAEVTDQEHAMPHQHHRGGLLDFDIPVDGDGGGGGGGGTDSPPPPPPAAAFGGGGSAPMASMMAGGGGGGGVRAVMDDMVDDMEM